MATEVIMPQMGFDMKEGTVVRWVKAEGDPVTKGEPLAEIETDKAVVEVEAYASGVLGKVIVAEGTTVPVGQVIGIIGAPGEELPEVEQVVIAPPTGEAASAPVEARAEPTTPTTARPSGERVKASPLARREAQARGIDISAVPGTGPNGRVTKDDVVVFSAQDGAAPTAPARPAPADQEIVPLSRMRQAIARNMARSKQEIPHFYVTIEVDMTDAVRLRAQLNEALEGDAHISINDMVLKASAKALVKHPMFNAAFSESGVRLHKEINIGMAIAMKEGLIAPAIMDCANRSLAEIAKASNDLVERARSGVLTADEYTGATFSVTNLGMYGVESFSAIITPPQSAALAVGAVRKVPMVRDGEVAVADMMKVTLSIDHRVADGAQAAEFLVDVRALLENPGRLLV